MTSTPSRCNDASQDSRTYSGSPRTPRKSPFSLRTLPNLVASTTSSRRPAMARPTRRSLVQGPYMSATGRDGAEVALRPRPPRAFRPVDLRWLDETGGEAGEVLAPEAGAGTEVAEQRVDGDRAAQDDARPRLRQRGAHRQRVGSRATRLSHGDERGLVTGAGEPAVGERLLDDHRHAGVVGTRERRPARLFEKVPCCLDSVEDARLDGCVHGAALVGPRDRDPDGEPILADPSERGEDRPRGEHAVLQRCRVDLVEHQVGPEELA